MAATFQGSFTGAGSGGGISQYIYLTMSSNFTAQCSGDVVEFDTVERARGLTLDDTEYEVELSGGVFKATVRMRQLNANGSGSKVGIRGRVTSGSDVGVVSFYGAAGSGGQTSIDNHENRNQPLSSQCEGFAIIDATTTTYYALAWTFAFNSSGTFTGLAEGSWMSIERIE